MGSGPINKAVQVTSFDQGKIKNGLANMELRELPVPKPKEGEVAVRISLCAVHQYDLMVAGGRFPGWKLPFTSGLEAVGTVEAPGSAKFPAGSRVTAAPWAGGMQGAWAQYVAVPETSLVSVPDGVSDQAASQLFCNPTTAVGLVDSAAVPKGKWLLQAAAGSAVGKLVLQYARHQGLKTISIVRRTEQVAELKALGADEVIDSSKEDVLGRVQDITGGSGAWATLDPIAGDFTHTALAATRQGGTVLLYGALAGDDIRIKTMDIFAGVRSLTGWVLGVWLFADGPEKANAELSRVMGLVTDGTLTTPTGREYPLEDFREAVRAMQSSAEAKVFLRG